MNVKISVTGLREIDDVIKGMKREMQHPLLQAAHANAAKPLVTRMQLKAPEGPTGNLVDSIGIVKSNIKKATQLGEIQVGPRRGRYKGGHGHLIEYGTKRRRTRKGANRGIMIKKPFVKPAFEQTKGEVENRIVVSLGKSLMRVMRKHLK